jgi:hypothetical protein
VGYLGKRNYRVFFAFCVALLETAAYGDNDKSQYWLFNPTPTEKMREMITDRPDKTESPYTADAGHFQIETDIYNVTRDKTTADGVETQTQSAVFMASNLKLGITNSIDFQTVVTPQTLSESQETGASRTSEVGFGDTTLRLKVNLMGNDGGDIAIGLMPFVKLPTASGSLGNGKIEGGLIFLTGIGLPGDCGLGSMLQVNGFKNDANNGYHTEFISTLTFGFPLFGELGMYTEFFSQSSTEAGSEWVATFDTGLTYLLSPNFQLDAGINIGLTPAADDLNPFVGFSARI